MQQAVRFCLQPGHVLESRFSKTLLPGRTVHEIKRPSGPKQLRGERRIPWLTSTAQRGAIVSDLPLSSAHPLIRDKCTC